MTAEPMPSPRGYAKPVVVPERLDMLVGPTTGSSTCHGADFDLYGVTLDELAAIRTRFAAWQHELEPA